MHFYCYLKSLFMKKFASRFIVDLSRIILKALAPTTTILVVANLLPKLASLHPRFA